MKFDKPEGEDSKIWEFLIEGRGDFSFFGGLGLQVHTKFVGNPDWKGPSGKRQ